MPMIWSSAGVYANQTLCENDCVVGSTGQPIAASSSPIVASVVSISAV